MLRLLLAIAALAFLAQEEQAPQLAKLALEREMPQLRRSLAHVELLARFEELASAEKDEAARARLAAWIALVAAEKTLLERAAPLERLRGRTPAELIAGLDRLERDAREEIVLARLALLLDQRGAAEEALSRARERDDSLKSETDLLIAEGRGEEVPRGGYFRYRGRFVSMEQRDESQALDEALERLHAAAAQGSGNDFAPSQTEANLAAFRRRFGEEGAAWLLGRAEEVRAALRAEYEEVRGFLPSYGAQPSLRRALLARREEMRAPRREALDLIARYDKPEQPQVDANRRNLERLYQKYSELLDIDRRGLRVAGSDRAWELLAAISAQEEALAAVHRYLSGWCGGGLAPVEPRPAPEADVARHHILPGREHSELEDSLRVVLHFAAGRVVAALQQGEELLRQRERLTPWEILLLEEIQADAIDLYNASCACSLDGEERRFVAVVNAYRRALGLFPFEVEERLNVSARKHSREEVVLGYFGHISPVARNRTPTDRARREGYAGGVGENCLGGHADGAGAFEGWYHSPGHHRNLVSGGPHLGIGATRDHGMWTMVAGGADFSWRAQHRDLAPAERRRLQDAAERLALALAAPGGVSAGEEEFVRALLPDVLPWLARHAFLAGNDLAAGNHASWPRLAALLIGAEVDTVWRPLQIAAVAAAIEGMEEERLVETRAALWALVLPLVEGGPPFEPKAGEAERRRQAQAVSVFWEDVAQFRFRQGAGQDLPPRPLPPGRAGDGPSLEAPQKALGARERLAIARKFGGSNQTEQAVELGLEWLARVQDRDGAWRARSFASIDRRFRGHEASLGLGNAEWDVAVTGLSLLAFLSAGNTPEQGEHAECVARGVQFLLERIVDYGKFETVSSHYMYGHAIATQALCEAYAYTADPRIGASAQLSVDYLAYAQHQLSGGWRYDANEQGDMSVTGWVVMALNSAYKARLDVAGLRGALRFLNSVTWPAYFYIGYQSRQDGGSVRLGAVGMLARLFLEGDKDDAGIRMNAWRLQRELPALGREDFYCWYYATLALFQLGGEPWQAWNAALVETLLAGQEQNARSPFSGSWPPRGEWSDVGGRVYQTALGVLMLTTYYRYDRARTPRVVPFTGDLEATLRPYLDLLKSGEDELVRAVAARKLADLFGTAAAPALFRLLRDGAQPEEFRRRLAELLPDCVTPDHEVALLGLLAAEKDGRVQESLILALEGAAGERSVETLTPFLEHESRELRSYAARALGRIGGPQAAAAVARRLATEQDGWCRALMNEALIRLSHRRAIDLLVTEALGRDAPRRLITLRALDVLDQCGIAERLVARKDAEPGLYARALEALCAHREAAAVPMLLVLLESADLDTRAEAIKLLEALVRERHGYEAGAAEEARRAALVRWQEWWRERMAEFGAGE
ncbi:MAG: HEAT repeat domain-containing protein [Planctomycetes bacterium]|nr:HEAT repeat domain-containing protein [Planctomycetota bacterium]